MKALGEIMGWDYSRAHKGEWTRPDGQRTYTPPAVSVDDMLSWLMARPGWHPLWMYVIGYEKPHYRVEYVIEGRPMLKIEADTLWAALAQTVRTVEELTAAKEVT